MTPQKTAYISYPPTLTTYTDLECPSNFPIEVSSGAHKTKSKISKKISWTSLTIAIRGTSSKSSTWNTLRNCMTPTTTTLSSQYTRTLNMKSFHHIRKSSNQNARHREN